MTFLFYAHSGLRYLVLLAGIVAVAYLAFALATGRRSEKPERIVTASFTGLLDLQILLGLLVMVTGIFYSALIGHLVMMLLAAGVVHWTSATAKKPAEAGRATKLRLVGVVVGLVLIVGGVMSIGRSVFESGPPSMVS